MVDDDNDDDQQQHHEQQQQQQQQQQQHDNDDDDKDSSSVQVAVRIRPMLAQEAGSAPCLQVFKSHPNDKVTKMVRIGGAATFTFDRAFDGDSNQSQVFADCILPLLKNALEGYNATVLAYGQTGSGKTYTIMGPANNTASNANNTINATTGEQEQPSQAGVIPRALQHIFQQLEQRKRPTPAAATPSPAGDTIQHHNGSSNNDDNNSSFDYEVRIQFLELYGEDIRDLLVSSSSSSALSIRDIDGEPEVVGATQLPVTHVGEALLCLTRGMMRRVTGSTAMNASSSRSHAILSVLIEQSESTGSAQDNNHHHHVSVKRSKFNFVDLAGSERQKRTKAEGQRLREGIDINKGLLVLGNVISALGDPKKKGSFVPYRDSKLTRLLKGSLGGNHRTLVFACASPSSNNLEETLNCLRYANRAKNIQNNAVVNVDVGTRALQELRECAKALAKEVLRLRSKQNDNDDDDGESGGFTVEMLQEIIDGTGGRSTFASSTAAPQLSSSLSAAVSTTTRYSNYAGESGEGVDVTALRLESTQQALTQTTQELQTTMEELFTVRAEKEMYRMRLATAAGHGGQEIDSALLTRIVEYEKEIAFLKNNALAAAAGPSHSESIDDGVLKNANAAIEHEKQQVMRIQSELGAYSTPQEDPIVAEEHAEQVELKKLRNRFLADDDDYEDEEEEDRDDDSNDPQVEEIRREASASEQRRQQLEASLLALSKNIHDKESLIEQLKISQKKYADMRGFYEVKLRQMEEQVREREAEREALLVELRKLEKTGKMLARTKDVQKRLKEKESHIADLRKRQRELVTLTRVSTRNEAEIERLRQEVNGIKKRKVEIQKMIKAERKGHIAEVQRLKKEVVQRDREANRWRKVSDRKSLEAQKAQQVAKNRLDQMGQLRAKYREAERKLRVRTVKQGVMMKAGIHNLMVGRRSTLKKNAAKNKQVDVNGIRAFLDRKVADIGRKEALADKLANEWEDHLELVGKKENLLISSGENGAEAVADELESVEIQLSFKEERIRQLAQRLGKKQGNDEPEHDLDDPEFLENDELKRMVKGLGTPEKLLSKILFGMVVRERRRVAALARTASSLDEKVLQAQKAVNAKNEAFRAYVEDEKNERAALAVNQNEQILSLMALVQHNEKESSTLQQDIDLKGFPVSTFSSSSDAKMLVLANERIEVLERQLEELRKKEEVAEVQREKDSRSSAALLAKAKQCSDLGMEVKSLRSSLRKIRDQVAISAPTDQPSPAPVQEESTDEQITRRAIQDLVKTALHPDKNRRRSRTKQNAETEQEQQQQEENPLSHLPSSPLNRVDFLNTSSDSELEEEVPSWAGDIMEDLAVIAEGNIPECLKGVVEFHDEHPPTRKQRQTSEGSSVFDRLTNPENFTGVQKQNAKQLAARQEASREKREQRKKVTGQEPRQAASQDESNKSEATEAEHVSHRTKMTSGDAQQRSVFDRLLSPNAYTGTQKEKMQEAMAKRSKQSKVSTKHSGGNGNSGSSDDTAPARRVEPSTGQRTQEVHFSAQVAEKVSDYAQKNVFERLQRGTQASAGKHQPAVTAGFTSTQAQSPPARVKAGAGPIVSGAGDVAIQTPTSVKKHIDAQSIKHESLPVSPETQAYTKTDVFERLTKTTTQSYAWKFSVDQDEW